MGHRTVTERREQGGDTRLGRNRSQRKSDQLQPHSGSLSQIVEPNPVLIPFTNMLDPSAISRKTKTVIGYCFCDPNLCHICTNCIC